MSEYSEEWDAGDKSPSKGSPEKEEKPAEKQAAPKVFKVGGKLETFDQANKEPVRKTKDIDQLPNNLKKILKKEEIEKKKQFLEKSDIVTDSESNRQIIYKFMKRGFLSLTADELATTLVNPTFTSDFKVNTGEDWNQNYHSKVIDKLQRCKYQTHWLTKQPTPDQSQEHELFFSFVKTGDIEKVISYLRKHNAK